MKISFLGLHPPTTMVSTLKIQSRTMITASLINSIS